MIFIFNLIIVAFEFYIFFIALFNYKRITNTNVCKYNYTELKTDTQMFILLPCYKEYDLLENTLDYFSKMDYIENISIILIVGNEFNGTLKIENDSYNRLIKIVNINSSMKFDILFDTTEKSTKSSKLNFALNYISNKHNNENIYCGVYDFDARPHKSTFIWIINDINSRVTQNMELPSVYQQIPITLSGLDRKNIFLSSYSIWRIRRSLGIEGISFFSRKKMKNIQYCMGSGMYINLKDLKEIEGFPEHSDDIALGYKMLIRGKKEVVIPYINSVYEVNSFAQCKKQHFRVYFGLFKFWGVLKLFEIKNGQVSIRYKIKITTKVLVDIFNEWFEFLSFIICFISYFSNFKFIVTIYILYVILFFLYIVLFNKLHSYRNNSKFITSYYRLLYPICGAMVCIAFRFYSLFIYFFKREKVKNLFYESSMKK